MYSKYILSAAYGKCQFKYNIHHCVDHYVFKAMYSHICMCVFTNWEKGRRRQCPLCTFRHPKLHVLHITHLYSFFSASQSDVRFNESICQVVRSNRKYPVCIQIKAHVTVVTASIVGTKMLCLGNKGKYLKILFSKSLHLVPLYLQVFTCDVSVCKPCKSDFIMLSTAGCYLSKCYFIL